MKLINIAGFSVIDAEKKMTWDEAMSLPAKANAEAIGGFTDWVLPDPNTLKALASILPESGWFWSSLPYDDHPNCAWYVHFLSGYVDNYYNDYCNQVRLVREGQCLDIVQAKQS